MGLSDNSVIINNKLLSSSEHNASTPTSNGRLNYTGGPSWCASSSDSTPYLQVDLGSVHVICAVATQGNSRADQWVKTYQIQSSEDSSAWKLYQESGQVVVRKHLVIHKRRLLFGPCSLRLKRKETRMCMY